MTHGTQAGYKNGCRCADCTEGARRARIVYLLRRNREGERTTSPVGTRRRILALGVLGWPHHKIARHAGLTTRQVQRIAAGQCAVVHVDTAAAVRKAFRELSMRLPPPGTCRAEKVGLALVKRAARAHGGFPPLAWDDIDDPDATPTGLTDDGHECTVDKVEWWLTIEPMATAQQCADRFGLSRAAVQQACGRAGRSDLLAQLARNVELAA